MKIAVIYPETLPSDKARTVTVVKIATTLGKISIVTGKQIGRAHV